MGHKVWTKKMDATLIELWGKGITAEAIARHFGRGITKNSVIGRMHRLRDAVSYKDLEKLGPLEKRQWNEEKYEILDRLVRRGFTYEYLVEYFQQSERELRMAIIRYRKMLAARKAKEAAFLSASKPIRVKGHHETHRCNYCTSDTYINAQTCYACAYRKAA